MSGTNYTFNYNVFPGLFSISQALPGTGNGVTVIGISNDGTHFTTITAADTSFTPDDTVNGQYLNFSAFNGATPNDTASTGSAILQGSQTLIDEINTNVTAAAPLSDTFYYEVTDGTDTYVDSYTFDLSDVVINGTGTPYATPGTTTPDTSFNIGSSDVGSLSVDIAPSTGQTIDMTAPLSVTIIANSGTLSINQSQVGADANTGETVSDPSYNELTINGTVGQINADLQGLTYTSGDVPDSTDYLSISAAEGPATTTGYQYLAMIDIGDPAPLNQVNDTYNFNVNPGLYGFSGGLDGTGPGLTVIGISTDGINFTTITAADTSFTPDDTVNGQYLSFSATAQDNGQTAILQDSQTLIDEINANSTASTPLTDTFYYEVTNGTDTVIDQVTNQLSDVLFNSTGTPYATAGTVAPDTSTNIGDAATGSLSVDVALSTGQASDADDVLSVTVSLFDFADQQSDGTLTINQAQVGSAANTGETVTTVTTGQTHSVTIDGTVQQINADLQGLTYNSPDGGGGTDSIGITATDGPVTTATYLIGNITTVPCYCGGTRIATPHGEVAVEQLAIGDAVLLASGGHEPVRWIGHRRIDPAAHPDPDAVLPIRIMRGAVADNIPARDLLVSPDHAVFLDGLLIQARQLVNHASIVQETSRAPIDYYHVQLDSHAVLYADGLTAESYLDTGNRGLFANADAPLTLHPSFARDVPAPGACAPLAVDAARVEPIWRRLAARAKAAPADVVDTAPLLRLLVGGRAIPPVSRHGDAYVFALPPGSANARLVSRAGRPSDGAPWLDDRRRLGVRVHRLRVHTGNGPADRSLNDPGLASGWHAPERDGHAVWRWTDGNAALMLPPDTLLLEVHAAHAPCYAAATTTPARWAAAE
jgi:hypothetical protein